MKRRTGRQPKGTMVSNKIKLIGVKNFSGEDKLLDCYFVTPDNRQFYVFSRPYTNHSYEICKSGIRVNELIHKNTRDTGVMRLIQDMNDVLPDFMEEYGMA